MPETSSCNIQGYLHYFQLNFCVVFKLAFKISKMQTRNHIIYIYIISIIINPSIFKGTNQLNPMIQNLKSLIFSAYMYK